MVTQVKGMIYGTISLQTQEQEQSLRNIFQTVEPRGEESRSIIKHTWRDPQLCQLLPGRLWEITSTLCASSLQLENGHRNSTYVMGLLEKMSKTMRVLC